MLDVSFSYAEFEYFLLIFTRVTCFIYIVPFFSMRGVPNRVKIGLGFFMSLLLYHAITPHTAVEYTTVWQYAVIVMREAVTGLFIGFGASICNSIVLFAGRIVDMDIALSMVNQMDPTTNENASVSGVYYQYMITLMLFITGMHRYLIRALADTFYLIPVNGAVFHTESLLTSMLQFMSEYIIIGFRICLPVFIVITLLNAVLGILAKVSPQMNMFAVGIQLKLMVGFLILMLTTVMLPSVANYIYEEVKKMTSAFVGGML
ncbi:MAG: flagellar biosynthetic protein FliR [Lachnospiraceae bacterium]|nr:flagellar biosynthetic protein FliR [Lachnospiraceae bacterium]